MNIETSNIPLIKGRIDVRRYYDRAACAVRAALRRSGETVTGNRTKSMQEAGVRKEQHLAQSAAQLTPVRYFR